MRIFSRDRHYWAGSGGVTFSGGNVTESFGNVVSIAGKYGIRKEEVHVSTKLARQWVNKSVDDAAHKYEQMVPEYPIKEAHAQCDLHV